jgi:hypothetical protein
MNVKDARVRKRAEYWQLWRQRRKEKGLKFIQFYAPIELFDALQAQCGVEGVPMSDLIERLLTTYLQQFPTHHHTTHPVQPQLGGSESVSHP